MNRHTLERGSKKHFCPSCGKKRFVKFIDLASGGYLPEQFGRCDREVECGYFMKPSQEATDRTQFTQVKRAPLKRVHIPFSVMKATRANFEANTFVRYLNTLFDLETVKGLIKKFNIGTTRHFEGGCIFWFIDSVGNICYGQVKGFSPDGHTARDEHGEQKITGVHYLTNDPWVKGYKAQENKISCLYGEHLLRSETHKTVAVVEAPKTAIICSVYFPGFIWVATGSLSNLTAERTRALTGRKVLLFPDAGCFKQWKEKGDRLGFETSDVLERIGSKGSDLADYITKFKVSDFIERSCSAKHGVSLNVNIEHPTNKIYFETLTNGHTVEMWDGEPLTWAKHCGSYITN